MGPRGDKLRTVSRDLRIATDGTTVRRHTDWAVHPGRRQLSGKPQRLFDQEEAGPPGDPILAVESGVVQPVPVGETVDR